MRHLIFEGQEGLFEELTFKLRPEDELDEEKLVDFPGRGNCLCRGRKAGW